MAASWFRKPSVLPGFGLTLGFATFFLSAIVLLPLAALILKTASSELDRIRQRPARPASRRVLPASFGAALLAAAVNAVFGFIVAWSLVRYDFPGRRLVDALIDLPFALPTAVSGIALATVFSPTGWLGMKLANDRRAGRLHVDRGGRGAHAHRPAVRGPLGAAGAGRNPARPRGGRRDAGRGPPHIFRRIILPAVFPALLTGFTLALARGIGEYGSVVFISGNLPLKTEITPLLIVIKLEQFDYGGAAALGFIMLVMSFVMLFAINLVQAWGRRAHARRDN